LVHRQIIADPRNDMCAAEYRRLAIHCVLSHELSGQTEVRFTSTTDTYSAAAHVC
jgi:hypothetical protein